jgi:hypothetical protein
MDYDNFIGSLEADVKATKKPAPGLVQSSDKTQLLDGETSDFSEEGIEGLFGNRLRQSYYQIKKESPRHRLILWMTLNGQKTEQIAAVLRIHRTTVSAVKSQPWFKIMFCRMTSELGKDSVQTLLEGEVVDTVKKLVHLRDNADSDNVKLSAANAILDRFLGKPTVKVESKTSGDINHIVHDADKLQKEYAENQKKLAARGLGITPPTGDN